MGFEDGRDCYIADSASSFSEKLLDLMANPFLREKFYENAFKVYNEKYSTHTLAMKRLKLYNDLI